MGATLGKGRNHYIHSTLDQVEWMYDFLGNYIVDVTYSTGVEWMYTRGFRLVNK
jgi:hypothetical protein